MSQITEHQNASQLDGVQSAPRSMENSLKIGAFRNATSASSRNNNNSGQLLVQASQKLIKLEDNEEHKNNTTSQQGDQQRQKPQQPQHPSSSQQHQDPEKMSVQRPEGEYNYPLPVFCQPPSGYQAILLNPMMYGGMPMPQYIPVPQYIPGPPQGLPIEQDPSKQPSQSQQQQQSQQMPPPNPGSSYYPMAPYFYYPPPHHQGYPPQDYPKYYPQHYPGYPPHPDYMQQQQQQPPMEEEGQQQQANGDTRNVTPAQSVNNSDSITQIIQKNQTRDQNKLNETLLKKLQEQEEKVQKLKKQIEKMTKGEGKKKKSDSQKQSEKKKKKNNESVEVQSSMQQEQQQQEQQQLQEQQALQQTTTQQQPQQQPIMILPQPLVSVQEPEIDSLDSENVQVLPEVKVTVPVKDPTIITTTLEPPKATKKSKKEKAEEEQEADGVSRPKFKQSNPRRNTVKNLGNHIYRYMSNKKVVHKFKNLFENNDSPLFQAYLAKQESMAFNIEGLRKIWMNIEDDTPEHNRYKRYIRVLSKHFLKTECISKILCSNKLKDKFVHLQMRRILAEKLRDPAHFTSLVC